MTPLQISIIFSPPLIFSGELMTLKHCYLLETKEKIQHDSIKFFIAVSGLTKNYCGEGILLEDKFVLSFLTYILLQRFWRKG